VQVVEVRINSKGAAAPPMRGGARDSASKPIVSFNKNDPILPRVVFERFFADPDVNYESGTGPDPVPVPVTGQNQTLSPSRPKMYLFNMFIEKHSWAQNR